jgi:hypothetical protein
MNGASRVAASDRLVRFFTSLATAAHARGELHAAVAWASTAAEFAWGINPGYYASPGLERLLLDCASELPSPPAAPIEPPRGVLHVLTRAYDVGGHARVVERWIARSGNHAHSLVVLDQEIAELPRWLSKAVGDSGGAVVGLAGRPALEKAALLRSLWLSRAEYAVDHAHPHDPIPTLAFGVEGGPPVFKFNAADHVFWLGASVADLVLEIRESGRECSRRRRGARAAEILGIPLAGSAPARGPGDARERLGIPSGACVLLTVASAYKYTPLGSWNFFELAAQALDRQASAFLLAVGPSSDGEWRRLGERFPGRVLAAGETTELGPLFDAADVYVDSLPFCSLTSSLEASRRGLAVHRYANRSAPLMSNDDPAFAARAAAAASLDYVEELVGLISDPRRRADLAAAQSLAVEAIHCSARWDDTLAGLAVRHATHSVSPPSSGAAPSSAEELMAEFQFGVSFLARFGIGVLEIRQRRHSLPLSSRTRAAVAVLAGYPGYFDRPKTALQAAREFLKQGSRP